MEDRFKTMSKKEIAIIQLAEELLDTKRSVEHLRKIVKLLVEDVRELSAHIKNQQGSYPDYCKEHKKNRNHK